MGSKRDNLKRRTRKTVKWGGAGLTVLLVVVWIGSGRYGYYRITDSWRKHAIDHGRILLYDAEGIVPSPSMAWHPFPPEDFDLILSFDWGTPWGADYLAVPLWFPALLALFATAAAWRFDAKYLRRARVGLCPACGYDRAGLAVGAVCPECGAAAEAR